MPLHAVAQHGRVGYAGLELVVQVPLAHAHLPRDTGRLRDSRSREKREKKQKKEEKEKEKKKSDKGKKGDRAVQNEEKETREERKQRSLVVLYPASARLEEVRTWEKGAPGCMRAARVWLIAAWGVSGLPSQHEEPEQQH